MTAPRHVIRWNGVRGTWGCTCGVWWIQRDVTDVEQHAFDNEGRIECAGAPAPNGDAA